MGVCKNKYWFNDSLHFTLFCIIILYLRQEIVNISEQISLWYNLLDINDTCIKAREENNHSQIHTLYFLKSIKTLTLFIMSVAIAPLKINLNHSVNRILIERWLNDRDIMATFQVIKWHSFILGFFSWPSF